MPMSRENLFIPRQYAGLYFNLYNDDDNSFQQHLLEFIQAYLTENNDYFLSRNNTWVTPQAVTQHEQSNEIIGILEQPQVAFPALSLTNEDLLEFRYLILYELFSQIDQAQRLAPIQIEPVFQALEETYTKIPPQIRYTADRPTLLQRNFGPGLSGFLNFLVLILFVQNKIVKNWLDAEYQMLKHLARQPRHESQTIQLSQHTHTLLASVTSGGARQSINRLTITDEVLELLRMKAEPWKTSDMILTNLLIAMTILTVILTIRKLIQKQTDNPAVIYRDRLIPPPSHTRATQEPAQATARSNNVPRG